MRALTALLSGLLFGAGLLVSGMTQPERVLSFLDLAGAWNPSLALVMLGAIAVSLWPMHWAKKHRQSLLAAPIQLPQRRDIDQRLVLGSITFGIGWGLVGLCPGPVIALLSSGAWPVWLFFIAMLAGMLLFEVLERQHSS